MVIGSIPASGGSNAESPADDLRWVRAGVENTYSETHRLPSVSITKATSSPSPLPRKPSELSLSLTFTMETANCFSGRRYCRGRGRPCLQTLLCGLRGSTQQEPRSGNSHSVEEGGDIPGATLKYNVKARRSLGRHRLDELFSEFISRGCLSWSLLWSRSKGIPPIFLSHKC